MADQGRTVPVVVDPCAVLGRLAEQLSAGAPLGDVLDVLVGQLGLRTAVLRSAAGDLLGVGGEALHAVPVMRAVDGRTTLELPVEGRSYGAASLTVLGARPSQLPLLRAAASVLGLALVPSTTDAELLEGAEDELDELADALHDGPVQSLVVARYTADAAVRGGDPAAARDAVQAALVELRRLLWSLRPRGGSGLQAALEQLAAHLVEAGSAPVVVVGSTDLAGPEAVLAFRLVQAVAGPLPVRVAVRADAAGVVVDVDGAAALSSPDRWVRRARALGGDLSASAGRLRLVFPTPRTADARTAP